MPMMRPRVALAIGAIDVATRPTAVPANARPSRIDVSHTASALPVLGRGRRQCAL